MAGRDVRAQNGRRLFRLGKIGPIEGNGDPWSEAIDRPPSRPQDCEIRFRIAIVGDEAQLGLHVGDLWVSRYFATTRPSSARADEGVVAEARGFGLRDGRGKVALGSFKNSDQVPWRHSVDRTRQVTSILKLRVEF